MQSASSVSIHQRPGHVSHWGMTLVRPQEIPRSRQFGIGSSCALAIRCFFLVIIMLYVDSGPYLGIYSGIDRMASPQFHILWISHRQECMRTSQWMLCGCIDRLYRPLLVTWRTHRNKQLFGDEHWTAILTAIMNHLDILDWPPSVRRSWCVTHLLHLAMHTWVTLPWLNLIFAQSWEMSLKTAENG